MPSRRNTLIGLGILAAGGTGAVATGAFTAATAERDVSVEFADDDAQAILGFQPTSDYADLEDGDDDNELGITFEDLNTSAQFTFNDTFIIINNGDQDIVFDGISSGEDDGGDSTQWRNEGEDNEAAKVLIAEEPNEWQATPTLDGDVLDPEEEDNVDDEVEVGDNTGVDIVDVGEDFEVTLESGDWVSIGFEIGNDDFDEFSEDDIPDTLQFEFGSGVQ